MGGDVTTKEIKDLLSLQRWAIYLPISSFVELEINNGRDYTTKFFFCTQCSLQFGKKYVFDVHLSFVHGKKDVTITNEGSKISFGESQKDGDSNTKNIENRKSFKCEICD